MPPLPLLDSFELCEVGQAQVKNVFFLRLSVLHSGVVDRTAQRPYSQTHLTLRFRGLRGDFYFNFPVLL